jgi:hypothetical protein
MRWISSSSRTPAASASCAVPAPWTSTFLSPAARLASDIAVLTSFPAGDDRPGRHELVDYLAADAGRAARDSLAVGPFPAQQSETVGCRETHRSARRHLPGGSPQNDESPAEAGVRGRAREDFEPLTFGSVGGLGGALGRIGPDPASGSKALDVAVGCDGTRLLPMAQAFGRLIEYVKGIAGSDDRIARGDLTVEVEPKSERDMLGNAFSAMVANLRDLVGQGVRHGQLAVRLLGGDGVHLGGGRQGGRGDRRGGQRRRPGRRASGARRAVRP